MSRFKNWFFGRRSILAKLILINLLIIAIIIKEIIDQHRGEVGLISRQDEHSFWFTVPLADA
ncbi:hypothetical protein [Desulfosporosinus metallidurans]|uniref:Uncharacterized protein n=1 Tax=Desulfosporosinus metallidurans TaxID=1888891 RepID=A0A1Q8QMP0_9FIRM|nr:hypothetical protein [Desulfosporosinus metallidurans]OLN28613.1 hypothetical protein DSOL_3991 [Desulfosporosinus metallidurans]